MRRIASVFGRRDKDRAVPQPVPPPPTPPPVPSLVSEQASSASSNGSALQTPDDYGPVLTRTPTKSKSFTAWLSKKSGTIKRGRPVDHNTPLEQLYVVEPVSDWRPTQPAPILHAPPTPKSQPKPPVLDVDIDSDEDASASGSDDDDESVPRLAPALHPPITPTSVAQSRKNLETLIHNSLVPPLALSTPFSHIAGTPMYPRSSNPPHSLPARPTMQTAMHRSLLLRRLQQPGVSALSVAQQLDRSILPFASRKSPTPVDPPSLPWFNDRVLPAAMRLSPSSPGLRRWMARPCFEERIAVWVPLNGVVTCQPVTGSSCAVAELEYSAALDAMIGFPLPPVEEEAPSHVAVAPVPTPQQPRSADAAAAAVRSTSYQAVPSPLRNSTIKPPKSPVLETPAPPSIATSPDFPAPQSPPAATTPTASRVRFVEDDKEDVIPLGYALRLKKRREEKAKFLREEQERRVHEEAKAKQEEERLRREEERRQWEEEKRAWEKEKRAMEEERKRRIYAEEVVATRVRREQQRAGGGYGAGETSLAASSSTTSLRDERNKQDNRRYSRPLHDQQGPWRQASEPAVPQHANTPSSSPHTSSPGSSRPPSIAGHQAGSLRGNSSRPPSVHNTSSEDVRQSTRSGKRSSMASLPGKMPNNQFDWSSYATSCEQSDARAFMLHQYPRPRSQNSQNSQSPGPSSPSASSSRQRLPSNGSSERVNVQHQHHSSSPSSRRGSNASSSPPIRPIVSHQRRSSDDARRTSMPPPKDPQHERGRSQPSSLRSPSSSSLPRGRPPMPSSYQQPSPWSAPPLATSYSQQQLSPAAIINGYGQRAPPKANRRQTTIS
ncbi:hypothetical protein B0H14DRAFT_2663619 [Mycena olivaceomarginata]|nr:hypothetical protein B0H14DRAFT_2663619 [Mycena olivaceomarginata]